MMIHITLPLGESSLKRGEGSGSALPGRYRAAPSRKRESEMLVLQRLENRATFAVGREFG